MSGVDVNFFADARIRYQTVQQENLDENAQALTLRAKGGVEVEVSDLFSALIEIEGSEQLIDDFNDTVNGRFDVPTILDVETIELNRLQLQSEIIPKTRVTLGRQTFALDNWRFLGDWKFRQNDQTIDALRIETSIGKGRANLGYFNKVHRHFGNDSPVGEFAGDSYVLNFSHPVPIGQVSLFHYAFDLGTGNSSAPVNTLSNATSGIRWHGRRNWDKFGIAWDASVARQSDFADNPNDYKALYADLGVNLEYEDLQLSVGVESLGSDDGVAVQTPLGSLHGFQGVTDRFFRTPADGLRDYHTGLKYDVGNIGPFERIQARAGYHWFKSDRNVRDYGRELNFGLSGKIKDVTLLFEYGDFNSRAPATDTGLFVSDADSLTLSASYSFD